MGCQHCFRQPGTVLAKLIIDANGESVEVTYGIVMENARQDAAYFTELCNSAGLCLVEQKGALDGFYLRFIK